VAGRAVPQRPGLDVAEITRLARAQGANVGFDLAHSVGNTPLALHDAGPDFAVWCHYKYLNSGPGAVAGCFVHERHGRDGSLPRFAGWWGHDEAPASRWRPPSPRPKAPRAGS
jgi:Kynureninase